MKPVAVLNTISSQEPDFLVIATNKDFQKVAHCMHPHLHPEVLQFVRSMTQLLTELNMSIRTKEKYGKRGWRASTLYHSHHYLK